jgi:hypothetical protein
MIEGRRFAAGPDARRRSREVLLAGGGLRNDFPLDKFFSIMTAGSG